VPEELVLREREREERMEIKSPYDEEFTKLS